MIKKVIDPTTTPSVHILESNIITSTANIEVIAKVTTEENELVSDRNIKKPKLTDE